MALGYVLKRIWRTPTFTARVVICLTLGIASSAAVLGLLYALLFQPPAGVAQADALSRLYSIWQFRGEPGIVSSKFSWSDVNVMRTTLRDRVAALVTQQAPVYVGGTLADLNYAGVDSDYFRILGVSAVTGSLIRGVEGESGTPGAVISYRLWRHLLGSVDRPLGAPLRIASTEFVVIGVAPDGFDGAEREPVDIWVPLQSVAESSQGRAWRTSQNDWLEVIAKNLTRTSVTELQGELRDADQGPDGVKLTIATGRLQASGGPDQTNMVHVYSWLCAASAILLLIAASNAGALMVLKVLGERDAIRILQALGASRLRLIASMVEESIVYGVISIVASALLVPWLFRVLEATLLNGRPVGAHLLNSGVAGLFVGLTAAALTFAAAAPIIVLASLLQKAPLPGRAFTAPKSIAKAQRVLLGLQFACTVVLVIGAGLFAQSLHAVRAIPLGIEPSHVVTLRPSSRRFEEAPRVVTDRFKALADSVAAIPGVTATAQSATIPLESGTAAAVFVDGEVQALTLQSGISYFNAVSPFYFRVIGTQLLRGRGFAPSDASGAPLVAIVNETFARTAWGNSDPLRRCVHFSNVRAPCYQIVGIAEDVHRLHVLPEQRSLQIYVPLSQNPFAEEDPSTAVLAHTNRDAESEAEAIESWLAKRGSAVPPTNVQPLQAVVDRDTHQWEVGARLFGALSGIALLLSSLGVYSLVGAAVRADARGLAIRVALGASRTDIVRRVSYTIAPSLVVGAAAGLVAATWATKLISSLMFGVRPLDPTSFGAALTITCLTAVVAIVPGIRLALSADPARALRD